MTGLAQRGALPAPACAAATMRAVASAGRSADAQGGVDHIHTIYRDPTNDYRAKFTRK